MPIVINGSGSITGISVGGLPDGIVDTDMLAGNAVSTAKIADGAVTSTKSTGLGGLSMADQWRTSSDNGENTGHTLTNWERNDNNFAQIGTGMTYDNSNGTFTFPSTGIYRIDFHSPIRRSDNITLAYIHSKLQISVDSGSNFGTIARSTGHIGGANNSHHQASLCAIVDVTNASTFRIRIQMEASTHIRNEADTNEQRTGLTFMKLGET